MVPGRCCQQVFSGHGRRDRAFSGWCGWTPACSWVADVRGPAAGRLPCWVGHGPEARARVMTGRPRGSFGAREAAPRRPGVQTPPGTPALEAALGSPRVSDCPEVSAWLHVWVRRPARGRAVSAVACTLPATPVPARGTEFWEVPRPAALVFLLGPVASVSGLCGFNDGCCGWKRGDRPGDGRVPGHFRAGRSLWLLPEEDVRSDTRQVPCCWL